MFLLTNDDVRQVLTMEKCLDAIEESTRRVGRGQLVKWDAGRLLAEKGGFGGPASSYVLRLRPVFDLVDGLVVLRINSWATAEVEINGTLRNLGVPISGERYPHNSEKSGWLHLYEMRTGKLLSIVQDRDIQVMRVGCVGGLNAKYMSRSDAKTIGLIGSGWMARSLIMGHCLVRDIQLVNVYSKNPKNRAAYCEQMSAQLGIEMIPVSSAEEAVRGADIVISATNSIGATFDPEWVQQGTHVYCVTGAEYDERMLQKADRIVWTFPESNQYDSRADATSVTGDPQKEKMAARKQGEAGYRVAGWRLLEQFESKRVFLTDVIEGRTAGRNNEKEITFSPSPAGGSSIVIRFAVLVPSVYEEAKQKGIGHDLPDEWFHQETDRYPIFPLR
ncbi:ornithine cyclodeaminase family protein [Thermodesulfobacteriota bacterium]